MLDHIMGQFQREAQIISLQCNFVTSRGPWVRHLEISVTAILSLLTKLTGTNLTQVVTEE